MTTAPRRVVVIGGGVIGLTTALVLRQRGHEVIVRAAQATHKTVSAVAGAICIPYRPDEATAQMLAWSRRGRSRYAEIAKYVPAAGIEIRDGSILFRSSSGKEPWALREANARLDRPVATRMGVDQAVSMTVPLLCMPVFLEWLAAQCRKVGVVWESVTVSRPLALLSEADSVIVCAGLASRDLVGDQTLTPVRGQVVRVRNTFSLERWYLDDENPAGVTYIFPRSGEIIVGGTHEPNSVRPEADPRQTEEIIQRAAVLEPQLLHAPVLGVHVGLRPARHAPRVEQDRDEPRLIHNYGHGGSGVTLAWGCAETVAGLVASSS